MTQQASSPDMSSGRSGPNPWAQGLIVFAAVMMIMAGGFHAIMGLVGIFENEFYRVTPNYVFEFDVTGWGWIHLLLGLGVVLAGFALLAGQTWARGVGIALAAVSALANFVFIPYYPFWSLAIIALDIFIIWALASHGRDITR
jgi:hypothetical protein